MQQEPLLQWGSLAHDFKPEEHYMQIERFDKRTQKKIVNNYLTVPNRLIWFIRDQRTLIAAGLAQTTYSIQTELVELDREQGWAHFKTYVRDVLGNEATMYGSESARDFPDYIEKASTKSLGRALLLLGYGTQFAPELDEGERVVDSPAPQTARRAEPARAAVQTPPARAATGTVQTGADAPATEKQLASIRNLYRALQRPEPDLSALTFAAARGLLTQLSAAYSEARNGGASHAD